MRKNQFFFLRFSAGNVPFWEWKVIWRRSAVAWVRWWAIRKVTTCRRCCTSWRWRDCWNRCCCSDWSSVIWRWTTTWRRRRAATPATWRSTDWTWPLRRRFLPGRRLQSWTTSLLPLPAAAGHVETSSSSAATVHCEKKKKNEIKCWNF